MAFSPPQARQAAAKAAIWAVGSVPERSPPSCPPPGSRGFHLEIRSFLIYRAPMPLGARTLWPLMVTRSAPRPRGVKGTFKKPCTASVWSKAGHWVRRMASAAAFTGWMVPSSLFTSITDTSTVSGRRAAESSSGSMCPVRSGRSRVTS